MIVSEKTITGLSAITVADFLQPPQVGKKPIFCRFFDEDIMKKLLALQL